MTASPGSSRLVTDPKALYHPRLPISMAGNGNSHCSPIPGNGACSNLSRMARNRYTPSFFPCATQFGTKFTSAHADANETFPYSVVELRSFD